MLRICRQCGTQYEGKPGSTLCSGCVAVNRKNVIRDRICRECGITFPGEPRAWYCPKCRMERKRVADRHSSRYGPARPLGSIDVCVICGNQYIVKSGNQRYCSVCSENATKAADRTQGREWYAQNGDPERRRIQRQACAAPINCRVCGKAFVPTAPSVTCSKECSQELSRLNCQRYEAEHRDERNAAHRKRWQTKKAKERST